MIKDSLVELVDLKKGVVSPASTKFLRFTDSFLVFKADNNKYGLLDKAGHILIPPISEMCIYQVFDSLLLLYYDSNYCYHDFENRAVKLPGNFREQDYRDVINFFIMKGKFNNRFRFQFDTVNIARKEFIPALIYFEEKYNETKFVSLKNMLDGFIGDYMDYCYVEGCFRYLTAFITDSIDCFQVDLDCGQNIFSTIDGPFNKVRGLGNGIVEYRNDELLASDIYVYRQISHFDYCRISGNKIDKLEFCDFFTPQSKALEKINACIDSLKNLVEFETLKLIEIENRMITENSNFSLGKDGITFWLNYLNDEKIGYPEDQFEITIPFNYLEEFIPENSLIDKIKKYFGKYE